MLYSNPFNGASIEERFDGGLITLGIGIPVVFKTVVYGLSAVKNSQTIMRKAYKIIFYTAIGIFLILMIIVGSFLGAGNNGYAQQYRFSTNSAELISLVEKLKKNPAYLPPTGLQENDSLDVLNHQFNVNIYSNITKTTFGFFIEKNGEKSGSTINLISVNKSSDYKKWQMINRDLNRKDNINAKRDFEKNILDKLKVPYTNEGNNMFIFWK